MSKIKVDLPDGSGMEMNEGDSALDLAQRMGRVLELRDGQLRES